MNVIITARTSAITLPPLTHTFSSRLPRIPSPPPSRRISDVSVTSFCRLRRVRFQSDVVLSADRRDHLIAARGTSFASRAASSAHAHAYARAHGEYKYISSAARCVRWLRYPFSHGPRPLLYHSITMHTETSQDRARERRPHLQPAAAVK